MEYYQESVRTASTEQRLPAVIRVPGYVQKSSVRSRVRLTRRAVFMRDGFSCQYCGSGRDLTLDHLVPLSKASWWRTPLVSVGQPRGDKVSESCALTLVLSTHHHFTGRKIKLGQPGHLLPAMQQSQGLLESEAAPLAAPVRPAPGMGGGGGTVWGNVRVDNRRFSYSHVCPRSLNWARVRPAGASAGRVRVDAAGGRGTRKRDPHAGHAACRVGGLHASHALPKGRRALTAVLAVRRSFDLCVSPYQARDDEQSAISPSTIFRVYIPVFLSAPLSTHQCISI